MYEQQGALPALLGNTPLHFWDGIHASMINDDCRWGPGKLQGSADGVVRLRSLSLSPCRWCSKPALQHPCPLVQARNKRDTHRERCLGRTGADIRLTGCESGPRGAGGGGWRTGGWREWRIDDASYMHSRKCLIKSIRSVVPWVGSPGNKKGMMMVICTKQQKQEEGCFGF